MRVSARHSTNQWEKAANDFDSAQEFGEPGPSELHYQPGATLRGAGDMLRGRGEVERALASYNRSAAMLETLLEKQLEIPWLRNEYAWTLEPRATLHQSTRKRSETPNNESGNEWWGRQPPEESN